MAATPCHGLAEKEWTFWNKNVLILMPNGDGMVADLQMNLNSRIYYLDSNFSFFEIFKYHPLQLDYVEQKICDSANTDAVKNYDFIWKRRSNLSGLHLQIIYINYPPLVWKGSSSRDVRGLYGEIFYALQEKLHFQYTIHHQEDNQLGTQANGSYSGLFGQIQSRKMNWSIADTTMTLERSEFFYFSLSLVQQHKKLVIRKPNEDFNYLWYLSVFIVQFWIVIIISAIVLSLFLFWIILMSSNHNKHKSTCLTQALAFTWLLLFGREIFSLNTNCAGKIICLVMVVWGFLISVSYNATLTSVLASSTTLPSIGSLEDLLSSRDYTLILKADGSARDYFEKAQENSIGKLQIFSPKLM